VVSDLLILLHHLIPPSSQIAILLICGVDLINELVRGFGPAKRDTTAVSARNDQPVHPGRDQSASTFSSFKSSDPPQPGRGPVDFVGTGLTG
jgi:hypothetical protein